MRVNNIWLIIDKDKTPDKRPNSVFLRLVALARRQPGFVLRTEKSTNFSLFQVRSSFVGNKTFASLKPRNADILAYIKALRQKGTEVLNFKTILSLPMISHKVKKYKERLKNNKKCVRISAYHTTFEYDIFISVREIILW